MIRGAANVLSDATQYTSVIVAPQIQTLKIRRVQLVPVTDQTALMIVVTSAGIVKDAVIRVPEGITSEHLYRISEMLTGQLADHTLSEVRQIFAQLFRDLSTHRRLLGGVMKAMEDKLIEDAPEDVVVGGPTKMLNYPEYSDVEKAKNFLTIFESKDRLAQIMKHSGGMEVTIRIGPENEIEELKDCSLVTATYRVGQPRNGHAGHHRADANELSARGHSDGLHGTGDQQASVGRHRREMKKRIKKKGKKVMNNHEPNTENGQTVSEEQQAPEAAQAAEETSGAQTAETETPTQEEWVAALEKTVKERDSYKDSCAVAAEFPELQAAQRHRAHRRVRRGREGNDLRDAAGDR